jgi:hypothetical protein
MRDSWSYDRKKRFSQQGQRWHFVRRYFFDEVIGDRSVEETPYELYFRDDANTEFGLLRFAKEKDNPYRDYESVIKKIMNTVPFRTKLLAPETQSIWKKPWK